MHLPQYHFPGIYKFTNKMNHKVYIGQAQSIYERYRDHSRLRVNTLFGRALRKYGIEGFDFEVLEKVENVSLLDEREQYWFNVYLCFERDKGYNICREAGTTRGRKRPKEELLAVSEYRKTCTGDKNSFWGKKHSEKTKMKISEARKKIKLTQQHIEAIRNGHKKVRKKIVQIDIETGQIIKVWSHAGDIQAKLGLSVAGIRLMCTRTPIRKGGKLYEKKHVGGFIWKYA